MTRSLCLILSLPLRPKSDSKNCTCTLCDASHTKTDHGGGKRRAIAEFMPALTSCRQEARACDWRHGLTFNKKFAYAGWTQSELRSELAIATFINANGNSPIPGPDRLDLGTAYKTTLDSEPTRTAARVCAMWVWVAILGTVTIAITMMAVAVLVSETSGTTALRHFSNGSCAL